ncbi:Bug family tripartite tricarboxylate transporter substrate binding protein [Chloroflexus sp.]|uniref:Bug family tripartite tricarboxylate transporter substrate binding protein n=1 Tax=Chloroflexus sp. TaxID=1904827 RepID=UPI0040494277
MRRVLPVILLIAILLSACGNQTPNASSFEYPTEAINIMAPASPGGGWDSTARAMQAALAATTDQTVQVYNVSGAGGTIGLAQFVNDAKGKPHELMVGGLVMVGAIQTNKAPVNLSQVTPIALLTAEAEAIVVPADSKYQTLQELIADFKANPTAISWGGGSAGGTDHILVGLIAKAVGVAPANVNYIAYSGGGEATAAILSGAVTAGVSGVSEFAEQVAAGTMRMLAVSSEQRIAGIDAPTLKEAGVDVALMNWRAVFGAPDLTPEQRAAVIAAIEKMHASKEWQDALSKNGWTDFFRTGNEFSTFLNNEITRIGGVLRDLGLVQ